MLGLSCALLAHVALYCNLLQLELDCADCNNAAAAAAAAAAFPDSVMLGLSCALLARIALHGDLLDVGQSFCWLPTIRQ